MTNNSSDDATRLLEGAYAIRTANDSIDYYREFADLYDDNFAERLGYVYPAMLAAIYNQYAGTGDAPIADIGCGTGLVAEAFKSTDTPGAFEIDGIDISPEMLDKAKSKNLYRNLCQADLTQTLNTLPTNYGCIVSAGTFTFGHLGPELLPDILQLGRSDTLYCIGVNSIYYKEQGFSRVLSTMVANKQISAPTTEVRKIYNSADQNTSDNTHATDTATILVYRQL